VVEIDRMLCREKFCTSKGTPWPRRNDGRVVVRTLLQNGKLIYMCVYRCVYIDVRKWIDRYI